MLEIINYSKTYTNGKKAVEKLNLQVKEGDLFAFIGHNGAGKTTTIKSIMGILPFEEGDILINGTSIKKDPITCKNQMAYLPDNPELYESITGLQYLNLIGDIYQVKTAKRREHVNHYGDVFQMLNVLNNPISSYSHGMKQKLALIGAFLHDPKILVLDEPFVGLDPQASFLLKQTMKDFCSKGGIIFFSTHILEVAQKLCNRIAIIKEGRLISTGEMEEMTKNQSLEDIFMELTSHD